jgi:hypothetical protein
MEILVCNDGDLPASSFEGTWTTFSAQWFQVVLSRSEHTVDEIQRNVVIYECMLERFHGRYPQVNLQTWLMALA